MSDEEDVVLSAFDSFCRIASLRLESYSLSDTRKPVSESPAYVARR